MKKILLSMSLMFVALTLTNCAKDVAEDVTLNGGKGFSITVNADSRATIDGYKTVWEAGDQIGFGGVTEASTYTTVRVYPYDYVAGNTFSNDKSTFSEANIFYAIYPYTAKSASTGYGEINTALATENVYDTAQHYQVGKSGLTQNGESANHIAAVSPMYWLSDGAVEPGALNIQMHHAASVMDFIVTNDAENAVTLKSFSFTVPETVKICGTYYVNVSTGALRASGATYVYSTQIVNIENAPVLAKGESMHVYMAVAPFELAAGDEVEISVLTTDDASYSLKKAVTAAVSFEKGKVNTQNIVVPAWEAAAAPMTVTELVAAIDADERSFAGKSVHGIISSISDNGANLSYGTITITDNNGQAKSAVKLYDTAANTLIKGDGVLFVGDEVVISLSNAQYATYQGGDQLKGILIDDIIETVSVENPLVAAEITIDTYNAAPKDWDNVLVKFTNVRPAAASVGKKATTELTFTDGTNELAVFNRSGWTAGADIVIEDMVGTLTGIAQMYNETGRLVPTEAAYYNDFTSPVTLAKTSVLFTAAEGSEAVDATVREGYALGTLSADAAWVTVIPADGAILIAVTENTGDAREATVSVPVTKEGATILTKTITVKQSAAGAAELATVTVVAQNLGYDNGTVLTSFTVEGITFTFGKGAGSNDPTYYSKGLDLRVYPKNTLTITGATITSLEFKYAQNNSSKGVCYLTPNSGEFTVEEDNWDTASNSTTKVATWTGSSDNISMTVGSSKNGALRISEIVITYEK